VLHTHIVPVLLQAILEDHVDEDGLQHPDLVVAAVMHEVFVRPRAGLRVSRHGQFAGFEAACHALCGTDAAKVISEVAAFYLAQIPATSHEAATPEAQAKANTRRKRRDQLAAQYQQRIAGNKATTLGNMRSMVRSVWGQLTLLYHGHFRTCVGHFTACLKVARELQSPHRVAALPGLEGQHPFLCHFLGHYSGIAKFLAQVEYTDINDGPPAAPAASADAPAASAIRPTQERKPVKRFEPSVDQFPTKPRKKKSSSSKSATPAKPTSSGSRVSGSKAATPAEQTSSVAAFDASAAAFADSGSSEEESVFYWVPETDRRKAGKHTPGAAAAMDQAISSQRDQSVPYDEFLLEDYIQLRQRDTTLETDTARWAKALAEIPARHWSVAELVQFRTTQPPKWTWLALLAQLPSVESAVVAKISTAEVTRAHLSLLRNDGWTSTEVLEFYMSLCNDRALMIKSSPTPYAPVHFFGPSFLTMLACERKYRLQASEQNVPEADIIRHYSAHAVSLRKAHKCKVLENRFLVFAHNQMDEDHFCLIIAEISDAAITLRSYDPLAKAPQKYEMGLVHQWLMFELRGVTPERRIRYGKQIAKRVDGVPPQRDGVNCGIFACAVADLIGLGECPDSLTLSTLDTLDFRLRVANALIEKHIDDPRDAEDWALQTPGRPEHHAVIPVGAHMVDLTALVDSTLRTPPSPERTPLSTQPTPPISVNAGRGTSRVAGAQQPAMRPLRPNKRPLTQEDLLALSREDLVKLVLQMHASVPDDVADAAASEDCSTVAMDTSGVVAADAGDVVVAHTVETATREAGDGGATPGQTDDSGGAAATAVAAEHSAAVSALTSDTADLALSERTAEAEAGASSCA
jgi:hypothetical protein